MAYRRRGEGDELVTQWEHVYILRRGDRWRVSLTIADGEMAAWAVKAAQARERAQPRQPAGHSSTYAWTLTAERTDTARDPDIADSLTGVTTVRL